MTEPRDYQKRTVHSIVARWRLSPARICCVAPTGAGKTEIGRFVMERYPELRWGWACHTLDLAEQARLRVPGATVFTVQGRFPENIDALILDECFIGSTLVGDKRIDEVKVGDIVQSVDHSAGMVQPRRVTKVFRKRGKNMWRLRIGATVIHCTSNHPFFVKGRGYVEAKNLLPGDLLCVWDYIRPEDADRWAEKEDLLEGMYEQTALADHGIHKSTLRQRTNDQAQSDAQESREGKGLSDSLGDGTQASGSGRQRERADSATTPDAEGLRKRLGSGVRSSDSRPTHRTAESLQARPGSPSSSDSNRGGRREPHFTEEASAGQEEGEILVWARLDRSEGIEQAGDGPYVYNLEVEGNHTYFANGILVHNCHHYAAEEWEAVMLRFNGNILGLTATPMRADGVSLRGLFDDITVAAPYSELIRGGYIVPSRTLRPGRKLDRGIALDPVAAYLKHGEGRVGFCFGRTIEICREYAERFTAFGVPAACVDANTPAEERRERIEGLGSGKYKILTSVYALTEGIDVPKASIVILARGCGHPSLLIQMGGRALRVYPGKLDALILDLPGVTWVHGFVHEDREYSLDGLTRKPEAMALRVCQKCGFTEESGEPLCARCGFRLPPRDMRPKDMGQKLIEATAGNRDLAETLELSRLMLEAKRTGRQDDWIIQRFKSAFGKQPELPFDVERRLAMYEKMKDQGRALGYAGGYAAARFKALYGAYPPRSW